MKVYKHDKANELLGKRCVQAKSYFIQSNFCIAVGSCAPFIR